MGNRSNKQSKYNEVAHEDLTAELTAFCSIKTHRQTMQNIGADIGDSEQISS